MLAGRDAVMTESRSPSSKTDEGWGEAARGEGLGVIRIGNCPRIREMGMLAASMDRPRVAGGVVLQHGQGAGVRVGGGERRAKDLVYGLIPSLREMVTSVTLPPGCLCETQGLTETGRFGVCRCPGSSAPWTASGSARVQVPAVMGQWMARDGSVRTDRRSRARRS